MRIFTVLFSLVLLANSLAAAQKVRIVAADKAAEAFLKEKLTLILGEQDFKSGDITIYLGRTSQATKARVFFNKGPLGEYGYRIVCKDGKNIFISGAMPAGTLFGAGDFLKRFAGWRKFYPGKTGEVINKMEKLNLPEKFDIKEVPSIPHYNPSSGNRDEVFSRTGIRVYHYATTHALDKVVPPAKYAKTHPEYYPVRYGKRLDVSKYKRAMGWNPCVSNPDMPKLLDAYLATLKRKRNITLSVNDGGGDCQCEKCEAIYKKHGNQYIEFYKTVNDIIAQKYPGKLGVFSAYGTRSNQAPKELKLGPHVMPFICGARPGIYDREIKAWAKTGVKYIGIYDYMYTFGSAYMVPQFYPHDLAKNWRTAMKNGLNALTLEVYSACSIMDAPRLYVMDELGWNMDADVDAVLNDYYVSMFGKAAALPVKKFYDKLEEIYCRKLLPSYYSGRRKACQFDNYTLDDITYLNNALDEALKCELQPIEKTRLELLKKCFNLSSLCIEIAVRGREIQKLSGTPDEIAAYAAKGYEAMDKLQNFAMTDFEEKEIFVHGESRFLKNAVNTIEKFKNAVIHSFLRPLIDNGTMKAFDKVTAALGKDKAPLFWKKFPALPPAQGQLKLLKTKAVNLIPDPGFEITKSDSKADAIDHRQFDAANYSVWTAVAADFELSTTEKHSGKYAAVIRNSEGTSCFTTRGKIRVKPDTWYRISVWNKSKTGKDGSCGTMTARFNHIGGKFKLPAVTMAGERFTADSNGKWHRFVHYFRTPDIKGGVMTIPVLLSVDSQNDGEFIAFDDLELIEL